MPKIKAIPDGMLMMQNLMQRDTPVLMDNVEHSIASVLSDLDMEVASSEGIRIELNNLRQKSANEKVQLAGLCDALGNAANAFSSTDQQLLNQAQELTYLVEHVSIGVIIGNRLHSVLSALGLWNINSAFGITEEGYSTIETAMGMIQNFLDAEAARAGRVSAAGEELYQYLQEHDPDVLFGQYSFATIFMDDLSGLDGYLYSLREWKNALAAIFTGGSVEGAAEAFLSDPDTCKEILRKVIDQICETDYLDVLSSDQEEALGIIGDLAKVGGYDSVNEFIGTMNEMIGDAEVVDKILKDYSSNIAMLESLREIAPGSGILNQTIDDLLFEYKNQAASMIFDDLQGKFEDGVIELADYALGLNIGTVDGVIQAVLGDSDRLNSIDTVLYTADHALSQSLAYRTAAEKIMSGNFTADDLAKYQQTFDLSKALTIEQYEAMYSYYDADSMEAKYLKDQLEQLKDMTYANFNYAQSFNSFKNDYSSSGAAGTMTSSGFSGGGGGGAF